LLVEFFLFKHSDLIVKCIHAPILNIQVVFGQVEVGANGVAFNNSEAVVVAVGDLVRVQPFGDLSFAVGLYECTVCGLNGLLQFDLGLPVPSFEIDLVKAVVAVVALKGFLRALMFVRGYCAVAFLAVVHPCALALLYSGFDRFTGGVGCLAYVIFGRRLLCEIRQIR